MSSLNDNWKLRILRLRQKCACIVAVGPIPFSSPKAIERGGWLFIAFQQSGGGGHSNVTCKNCEWLLTSSSSNFLLLEFIQYVKSLFSLGYTKNATYCVLGNPDYSSGWCINIQRLLKPSTIKATMLGKMIYSKGFKLAVHIGIPLQEPDLHTKF